MNKLMVGVAEFFGVFGKLRKWFKGKKTIISAVAGILASASAILVLLGSWIEGVISANEFMEQAAIPTATLWAAVTFLFSAIHADNMIDNVDWENPEL